MRKGLTLFKANGRWRGIMPFRRGKVPLRNQLSIQRRTGEPSPSTPFGWEYPEGYGKAAGSYTEKVRLALYRWVEDNLGSMYSPLTFEYRLSRHRRVVITGQRPYFKHSPSYGKGSKGFILELTILSIDGLPFRGIFGKRIYLAWDRIIGKEKLLALPEPGDE